ncbi:hypothetical protein CRYUN_Cryun23aG0136500 [Craigia yunnanensis]
MTKYVISECVITRIDAIRKKYEKYDIDKQKQANVTGDDAFARLDGVVESELGAAIQKSEAATMKKNRATAVAMNVEIRRTKARLLEELPKLRRLALKKLRKVVVVVFGQLHTLQLKLTHLQIGDSKATTFNKLNSLNGSDKSLEIIAEGLDTLKNMAHDMNEELDRQLPLMDEIYEKVDRAASDLKSTNVRLKDTVNQLRSSRNFCIDIIPLFIILGIAAYLYNFEHVGK